MTSPFPPEAQAGARQLTSRANEIYGHFAWIARWSDEIVADTDLDLKKLAQLAFVHCRQFVALTSDPTPDLVLAVEQRMGASGVEWPTRSDMRDDLVAIRGQADVVYTTVRDASTELRSFARRVFDAQGRETDEPVVVAKADHPGVVSEVETLRGLFA